MKTEEMPHSALSMFHSLEAHLLVLRDIDLDTPEACRLALEEVTRLSGAVMLVRERLRRMAPDRPPHVSQTAS